MNKDNLECFSTIQVESKKTLIMLANINRKPIYADTLIQPNSTSLDEWAVTTLFMSL